MGNFLQECFPAGKSQFDKTDTVCKQQFRQAFFKKKSFGFQFQEVLLFLFLFKMLQHIVYIKILNLNSVSNFAFIDIYLDCKCPFPSELEILKIFCLPSHPDWKDIWKHGIYHRMESWIPLQLQLSQVTGASRRLSKGHGTRLWKSLSRNVVEPPVAWGMLKLIWQSPGEYVLEGNLGLAGKWTGCLKTFFMLPWREDKMFILVSGFNRFGDISSYWRLQNYSAQRLLLSFLYFYFFFFSGLRAIWAETIRLQLWTQNLSRVTAGVKKHFSTWKTRF